MPNIGNAIRKPERDRAPEKYQAEHFGDNPALTDELADLIRKGIKTATCSALWEWEAEGSPLPEVGLKTIVLDSQDNPICIIETIEVRIQPFHEVDSTFADAEGEGDRTLASWREAHWKYFCRVLSVIHKQPIPEILLVCERFRIIYK